METPYVIPRQDLLASPINFTGFIAEKVLPTLNVMQWSGSRPMAPADVTTTAGGRDGNGNMIENDNKANLVPFDISQQGGGEIADRQSMGVEKIAMYVDKIAAERKMAQTGILRIRTSIETAVRAVMVANPVDITADRFNGLLAAVQSKKGYGKVAIGGSYAALNAIRGLPEVKDRMKNIGSSAGEARAVSDAQLAEIFTADQVVEATSPGTPIWTGTELVVWNIADPAFDPAQVPQVGRFFNYTWVLDGQNWTITCEELFNPSSRKMVLDFVSYGKAYLANPQFKIALSI